MINVIEMETRKNVDRSAVVHKTIVIGDKEYKITGHKFKPVFPPNMTPTGDVRVDGPHFILQHDYNAVDQSQYDQIMKEVDEVVRELDTIL